MNIRNMCLLWSLTYVLNSLFLFLYYYNKKNNKKNYYLRVTRVISYFETEVCLGFFSSGADSIFSKGRIKLEVRDKKCLTPP